MIQFIHICILCGFCGLSITDAATQEGNGTHSVVPHFLTCYTDDGHTAEMVALKNKGYPADSQISDFNEKCQKISGTVGSIFTKEELDNERITPYLLEKTQDFMDYVNHFTKEKNEDGKFPE